MRLRRRRFGGVPAWLLVWLLLWLGRQEADVERRGGVAGLAHTFPWNKTTFYRKRMVCGHYNMTLILIVKQCVDEEGICLIAVGMGDKDVKNLN